MKDLDMFVCRLSSDLTDFIETEDLDTFRLHDLEHTSVSVKAASCACRSGFVLFHAVAVKDEGHCSFSKGIVITVLGSLVVASGSPQGFSTSHVCLSLLPDLSMQAGVDGLCLSDSYGFKSRS